VRGMRKNITLVAVIAGIIGMLFAIQNISLVYDNYINTRGTGILTLVARNGLNMVFPDSPAMTVLNLLPLFILTFYLGDDLSGDLMLSGIYGFTRGITRRKWYLIRVSIMAVYSIVFWLCYGFVYTTVFTLTSSRVFSFTGYDIFLRAILVYLAPFTLFSLLWTNLISLHKNITIACACTIAVHCLFLFALLITLNTGSAWGTILNPLANSSYISWNEGFGGLVNPKFIPFSYVYWVIMLGITIAVQLRYYMRTDILD